MKKFFFIIFTVCIILMTGCDQIPEFKSTPVTEAWEGIEYQYIVEVIDPDGKNVDLEIIKGPQGMVFHNNVLKWTPTSTDGGEHEIKIRANDGSKYAYQEFTITCHFRITGLALLFNLTDETYVPFSNSYVRLTGGDYDEIAAIASDGSFIFYDIPSPTDRYRFDFYQNAQRSWTIFSNERNIYFCIPARVLGGTAKLTATMSTEETGTINLNLLGNAKSIYTNASQYTFTGLYPITNEVIVGKQWKQSISNYGNYKITSWIPKTYTILDEIILENNDVTELDFILVKWDEKNSYLNQPVTSTCRKIERDGYYRIEKSDYKLDLSRQVIITNKANSSQPLPLGLIEDFNAKATVGSNVEQIFLWTTHDQWSSFLGMNLLAGYNEIEFKVDPPHSLSILTSNSSPAIETLESVPFSMDNITLKLSDSGPLSIDLKQQTFTSEELNERPPVSECRVLQGSGLHPLFVWQTGYTGADDKVAPEIFLVTVCEITSSNAYISTIWQGAADRNSIQFPDSPQLLQYGKRYMVVVTALTGTTTHFTKENIFIYPQSELYYFARSSGMIFQP